MATKGNGGKTAKKRGTTSKPKFDQITNELARTASDSLGKLVDFGHLSMKFASSFTPQVERLQRRIQRDGKLRKDVAKDMIQAGVELYEARRDQRERLRKIEDHLFDAGLNFLKAMASSGRGKNKK